MPADWATAPPHVSTMIRATAAVLVSIFTAALARTLSESDSAERPVVPTRGAARQSQCPSRISVARYLRPSLRAARAALPPSSPRNLAGQHSDSRLAFVRPSRETPAALPVR